MWSLIIDTPLELQAYIHMKENEINGCKYHNNTHINQMYQYLEDTNEPYDEALDWAVLFHDAVYDAEPDKELRSAKLFFEMSQKYPGCNLDVNGIDRVQFLIIETIAHEVTDEAYLKGSSAIIRADLHALADKVETIKNFLKIMIESMNLYKCSIEEFATNNITFMSRLRERVASNILVDKEHEIFYNEIINGIDLTIRLAKSIKDAK